MAVHYNRQKKAATSVQERAGSIRDEYAHGTNRLTFQMFQVVPNAETSVAIDSN